MYSFHSETQEYSAFEYNDNSGDIFEFKGFEANQLGIYRNGIEVGTIETTEGFHPSIDSAFQGCGLGKRMYQHWIQYQMLCGFSTVRSDASVSPQSRQVWHSLVKLGYTGIVQPIEDGRYDGQVAFAEIDTRPVAADEIYLPWNNEEMELA